MEMYERPLGYVGPNLNPEGLTFRPLAFSDGVYALLASPMPCDNSGLIVGKDAALMIDAGVNGEVAHKLQSLAARLTDRPLKYLINTNYHGDHTFGNYAFSNDVEIISHRNTVASMKDLEYEKKIRSRNLFGHDQQISDVTHWRKPDRVFDDYLAIDLGGRTVHLHYFGPGNTPGDTIVYLPEFKLAWTGNFVGHKRILPMLLEIGPLQYIETLERCQRSLDVEVIVPGHGPLGSKQSMQRTVDYLWALYQDVHEAFAAGLKVEAAVSAVRLGPEFRLPWWFPIREMRSLMENFQRLNVLFTYRELQRESSEKGTGQRPAA
jgi:cyclase